MSLPRPALHSCASCAERTAGNFWCARCHTLYCSRPCQVAHWGSGGHKKACKGLARAHRDTDLEVQSRALAHVSCMSGGAPADARCLLCLEGGDAVDPLVRGCACRGSSGWTHAGCLVKVAEAARVPPPPAQHFAAWLFCSTCKQHFTGLIKLRLAIALWTRHASKLETNQERLAAASSYADALGAAGEHSEAARLQRGILGTMTRMLGPAHPNTRTSASNLALSLTCLGEHAEAAALLQKTLAARTRTSGPDNTDTLVTESHLVNVLLSLGEYAEAEALGRETLVKKRHVLGPDHFETLITSSNLAVSLSKQDKHAEAVEIQREVLVSTTRLLGAEHAETLRSATSLAVSLVQCGEKTEGEQLIRDTLALAQLALGPTHERTQWVLQNLRALGFAAR